MREFRNLTQSFLYETDSLDSLEKVLDTMVKILYKEKPSSYTQLFVTKRAGSFYDGKKWVGTKEMSSGDPQGWSKPDCMHICTIGDYNGDIQTGDVLFKEYASLVKRVMEHVKNANPKKFFEQCGDGYDSSFNHYDGSIGAGYRINKRESGGWNNLDISLCHIFYGK